MLASIDNNIHIWEADQCEPSYHIQLPIKALQAALFTKDPRKLVVGGKNEELYEVDIYNRKKRKCNLGEGHDVKCLAANSECDLIAVGSSDGTMHLITYPEFVKVATFSKYDLSINSVSFLKDGKTAVCGDSVGHLIKFGVHLDATPYGKLTTQYGAVLSLQTLQTGDLAVIHNRSLYIYDYYDETPISVYDIGTTAIICPSKIHYNHVIIGTQSGKVLIYDINANSIVSEIPVTDGVTALTLTPDGQTAVVAYTGGIDMFTLYNPKAVSHYPTNSHHFATALSYQSEIIAIPDDAVFDANSTNPSQLFFSKSQIGKSRSMRLTEDMFPEEEEDYTENKIAFRRSLKMLNEKSQTPGKQCLTKSGILSSTMKDSAISNESEKHVSGILTFSKTGSPMFKSKEVKAQTKIVAPPINDYPEGNSSLKQDNSERSMPSILNSPRCANKKNNNLVILVDNTEVDSDIPDSPYALKGDPITPDDLSGCNSPVPGKSFEIDEEASTQKLRNMNEEIIKKLNEISERLSVLESKSEDKY